MTDQLIEHIALAWLHHQGYTDDEINTTPHSHREAGCESEGYQWNCYDEHGSSLHPVWDAILGASEIAGVVAEALDLKDVYAPCVEDEGRIRPLWNWKSSDLVKAAYELKIQTSQAGPGRRKCAW